MAQRRIVDEMIRYGGGDYLPQWALGHDKRLVMESLVRRGVVTQVRHPTGEMVYRLAAPLGPPRGEGGEE